MIEVTIANDQGVHTYDAYGHEVVQVYEGDAVPTFLDRYKKPIWYTEVLFDHLAKHDGLGMHRYLIEFYRKSIARQEAGQAACNVTEIRNAVREHYRDQQHDCRVAAMVADQEWKLALEAG